MKGTITNLFQTIAVMEIVVEARVYEMPELLDEARKGGTPGTAYNWFDHEVFTDWNGNLSIINYLKTEGEPSFLEHLINSYDETRINMVGIYKKMRRYEERKP